MSPLQWCQQCLMAKGSGKKSQVQREINICASSVVEKQRLKTRIGIKWSPSYSQHTQFVSPSVPTSADVAFTPKALVCTGEMLKSAALISQTCASLMITDRSSPINTGTYFHPTQSASLLAAKSGSQAKPCQPLSFTFNLGVYEKMGPLKWQDSLIMRTLRRYPYFRNPPFHNNL